MQQNFRIGARTLHVLEWGDVQQLLVERARTPVGRQLCAKAVPGAMDLERSQIFSKAVMEALDLKRESQFILPLGDIPDLGNLLLRISRSGSMLLDEFAALVRFQKSTQALHHFLNRYAVKKPNLLRALEGIELLENWTRKHFPLLDLQGQLVDGASEDLRALRGLAKELHEKIRHRLDDFLHNPKLAELMQDFYVTVRDGRYVIPVKTNFRGRVPGIVHDVSNTESTLFIEPQEVVESNNQLKMTEKEIEREIERILAQVVEATKPVVGALGRNLGKIADADFISAGLGLVESWNGQATVAKPGSKVAFEKLFHPVLCQSRKVVANDLQFSEAFILTGPNTGGKTVLLKSVGLCIALAWSGLPVPADSAEFPADLNGLIADIGDDQSIEQNLSTFSGHLLVLKEMIETSQAGDLVLVDEIATGTSPEDGQPLAQAVIEELLNRKVRAFITTHYGSLKQFAMMDERCRIASMAFDSKSKRPSFEVVLDIPGESSAFEIADQLGFPTLVTERAKLLRGEVSKDMKVAISRLEDARAKFLDKVRDLETREQEALTREQRAQSKVMEFESKMREGLSVEAREVLKGLQALREELALAVKKATQGDLSQGANPLFVKISDAGEQVRSVVEHGSKFNLSSKPLEDADLVAGAVVEVEGFGLGAVVEIPRDLQKGPRTSVLVQMGDLQTSVQRSKLRKASADRARSYQASRAVSFAGRDRVGGGKGSASAKAAASSGSKICDVRGKTVDDAMRRIESALNELAHNEDAVVTIIHGHGSDRLKDSIRGYIQKERDDLCYRSGTWPGEGGDGVTVVERAK